MNTASDKPGSTDPAATALAAVPLLKAVEDEEHTEREQERERFATITTRRRILGYWLGGGAIAGILGAASLSAWSFHRLAAEAERYAPGRFWALAGGHVVLTLGLVFFFYQVLRAAERLALPHWWVERNPELARLMLGIRDPATSASKVTGQAAELVAKISTPIADAVSKIVDVAVKRAP